MHVRQSAPVRSEFKRRFSFGDLYRSFFHMPRAIISLKKNRKKRIIDNQFIERIMLAVTEVNGCAVCSYAHTRMALREGLTEEEIAALLNGDTQTITPYEAKAIIFAQHYADTKGYPDSEAQHVMSDYYGPEKSQIITGAIQVIMAGNMYGIPYSAFSSRLRGNPYRNSTLRYELSMLVFGIIMTPIALLHGLVDVIFGRQR